MDDADLRGVIKNDGAITEGVRADRRHGDGADFGADDGAAGGEVVSGRTGGGGEDEAVAMILGDGVAIGGHLQADEADAVGFFEHDVVEPVNGFATARGASEHGALGDFVVPLDEFGQVAAGFFLGEGGEKSEFAEVDAEHGGAGFERRFEYAEEGAVATDGAAEVLSFEGVGLEWIVVGDGGLHAFALGDAGEVARGFFGTGLGGVDRERDGLDRLHRREFIPRVAGFRRG